MKRTVILVIGFVLFLVGMYSLAVGLVGAKVTYLLWLERMGAGVAFFTKLAMVMVGIILIYLSRTNWQQEQV